MFCPYCGKETHDEDLFCRFCGNKLLDIKKSGSNKHIEIKGKKLKVALISAVIIIAIAVLAIIINISNPGDKTQKSEEVAGIWAYDSTAKDNIGIQDEIGTTIYGRNRGNEDVSTVGPAPEEDLINEPNESEYSQTGIETIEKDLTEAECIDEINRLKETEAIVPEEADILVEMADCVTLSRILSTKGKFFSKMDDYSKALIRYHILKEVMFGKSEIAGAIPMKESNGEYDAENIILLDDAEALFKDIYGEEDFVPTEFERVENGYMLFSLYTGEPWEIVDHMQFFEDENYYLLTGPLFYGDNGGATAFIGYADILYAKNPDSRFGVTMVYGRIREDRIRVTSVDTSSELPNYKDKTYSGKNLVDSDYSTVWCEGVPGTGAGETITLFLDKEQLVYGIMICNGYTASYELYNNNGMLTEVSVDFGNGSTIDGSLFGFAYEGYTVEDLADYNSTRVELDEPVITDKITITIISAEKGAKYDDTCVSEIQVY